MIKRRSLPLVACCLLHATRALPKSTSRTEPFSCRVINPQPSAEQAIQDYSSHSGADPLLVRTQLEASNITDYGVTFTANRWTLEDGLTREKNIITLGVHFLDGGEEQRKLVRRTAPEWFLPPGPKNVAFRFDVPRDAAQIRISFNPAGGNWSNVGRQAKNQTDRSKPTMNIQNDAPWVIFHEFGHALGLEHEHHSPNAVIRWNESNVIADLIKENPGWDADYVRRNVIARFGAPASCVGDPSFNKDSIMLYEIRKDWTTDNFISPLNERISIRDYHCLESIYRV